MAHACTQAQDEVEEEEKEKKYPKFSNKIARLAKTAMHDETGNMYEYASKLKIDLPLLIRKWAVRKPLSNLYASVISDQEIDIIQLYIKIKPYKLHSEQ